MAIGLFEGTRGSGLGFFRGRLALIGALAASLFIFGAVFAICHADRREHCGGEVVECGFGLFEFVERAVEFGELGVVLGELGCDGVDLGLKGLEGMVFAEVEIRADGSKTVGTLLRAFDRWGGAFTSGHFDFGFEVTKAHTRLPGLDHSVLAV